MSNKNFLGIPIDGNITHGDKRKSQRPLAELAPIMQTVLNDPAVVEFGWKQYTPYFNDGDPCVFSPGEIWVRTPAEKDVDDLYELEVGSHPSLGARRWNHEARKFEDVPRSPEVLATAGRCKALNAAIAGGEFDDVLLEAFGDHAEITVRRDGIKVDFYDHD